MKHLTLFLILALGVTALGDSTWSVPGRSSNSVAGAGTLSTTASQVIAGNKGRRSCLFRNIDATISVYVDGVAGVTSSTGQLVRPYEVYTHNSTGPLYAVAASGTPAYRTTDEYD